MKWPLRHIAARLSILCLMVLPGYGQTLDSLTANHIRNLFHFNPYENPIPEFEGSYGVVFRDLNNDRLADIYVIRFRDLNRLFINEAVPGFFRDQTIESGTGGNLMTQRQRNLELGTTAVDANDDGKTDILITGWGTTSILLTQQENLAFSPAYSFPENHFPVDANAGVWSDIDNNGTLDLYLTDEHFRNHLLLNNGYGQFEEAGSRFNVDLEANSHSAAFGDVDGDNFPDLYVCTWGAPDVFYRNIEGRQFEAMPLNLPHLRDSLRSNGVTFGDIDNDGDLDLLVTDRQAQSRLYRNDTEGGQWTFTDITASAGLQNPYPAYGSLIADLNNDGLQDILLTNIGPNRFYLNRGKHFTLAYDEKIAAGASNLSYSTGAAAADYDNDGDLDIFVANKDTHSVFFENPLNSQAFLRIRPEGFDGNRDAIGAKIWLYEESDGTVSNTALAYREISAGSGYLSMSEPVAHFGVQAEKAYRIVIRFPSGTVVEKRNIAAGSMLDVPEISGIQQTVVRSSQRVRRWFHDPNFWPNLLLSLLLFTVLGLFSRFAAARYNWDHRHIVPFFTGALALSYLLFLWLPNAPLYHVLLLQMAVLLGFMILISLFLEQIRRLEQQRFGYRELLSDFSQQLIFIKSNQDLFDRLTQILQEALKPSFSAVFELQNRQFHRRTNSGKPVAEGFLSLLDNSIENQLQDGELVELTAADHPAVTAGQRCLLLPLSRKGSLFGTVVIGDADLQGRLPARDRQILQILANQASIAIENNRYIEESKQLTQKLTEAEIREHYVRELESQNAALEKLYKELQETQSQLIQSEKMASLGQLVAGVAHELNNPISFVYANMRELQNYAYAIAELLELLPTGEINNQEAKILLEHLEKLKKKHDFAFIRDDIGSLVEESLEGSERVKNVVQNLRNFSRLDEAEFKRVDLHEGLNSTLVLLKSEIKNHISIEKDYGKLPAVLCNPGNINQVFMNLLHNAIQALDKGGTIRITTAMKDQEAIIHIEDDGPGIPPEIQGKIFDPFFTTKPVGKGTGLGLSISYNIIQKHGGKILVDSQSGKGTTFSIQLPIDGPPKNITGEKSEDSTPLSVSNAHK